MSHANGFFHRFCALDHSSIILSIECWIDELDVVSRMYFHVIITSVYMCTIDSVADKKLECPITLQILLKYYNLCYSLAYY